VLHPDGSSDKETGQNLRRFKLQVEADSKYLASALLEEWEKVKDEVDRSSPLYRAVLGGFVFPKKENLVEGGVPIGTELTKDILFGSRYDRPMTESERFNVCMSEGGFRFLFLSYPFVRLLKESPQTPAIKQAIERLERSYEVALEEIKSHVDFDAFEVIDCDMLAKVQLGSGLIVLNSLLERRAA
jgi:hypothetical protein